MRRETIILTLAFAVCAAACSPSAGQSDGANEVASESGGSNGSGGATSPGTGGGPDFTGLGGRRDDGGAPAECTATYSGEASFQPVRLAFAFDVSASMGQLDKPYHDPKLKWEPVVAATMAFFEDVAAEGISASLRFFPIDADEAERCDDASYLVPNVPMTALPSSVFRDAIASVTPKTEGDWISGTPTLAVVQATLAFIAPLAEADPASRYAVVLVTDGYPQGCDDNDISSVADAVRAAAPRTPTYVVGVSNPPGGPDTVSNLNEVASAGGTERAFIVATGDPERTKTDFRAAVTGIRSHALSCEFTIPELPSGQVFDPNAANVAYSVGPVHTELGYDEGCTSDAAWRYDDPSTPTRVELCAATCEAVKSAPGAAVQVDFGCQRRTAIH